MDHSRATADSQQVAFVAFASAAVLPYDQVKADAEFTGGSDKPFLSGPSVGHNCTAPDRARQHCCRS